LVGFDLGWARALFALCQGRLGPGLALAWLSSAWALHWVWFGLVLGLGSLSGSDPDDVGLDGMRI
jgi:hypothetical protein